MTDHEPQRPDMPGAGFSESSIAADGFDIRYREAGQGDVLVSLHGGGGLRLSRAHEILAGSHRVIAFEIPGFGDSPANQRSSSLEDLASTMNQAVTALGIEQFNLMGNSFGAKLALWIAINRPEPVQAAVLIAPAAIRLARPSPMTGSPDQAASLLYAHPERQPAFAPLAPDIDAKQRALVGRLIGPPRDDAFEARLRDLETQVLALFGTADLVTPPTVAHLYRETLPNCHLVMVYDAAHAIDAERPEAVASVVQDFLARHESFLVREQSGIINP